MQCVSLLYLRPLLLVVLAFLWQPIPLVPCPDTPAPPALPLCLSRFPHAPIAFLLNTHILTPSISLV
jgi:hypothetical protein